MIIRRFGILYFIAFDKKCGKVRFIRLKKWQALDASELASYEW